MSSKKEKNNLSWILQIFSVFLLIISSLFLFAVVLPHIQPDDMIKISSKAVVGLLVFLLVYFLLDSFILEILIKKIHELKNNELAEGTNYQKVASYYNEGIKHSIVRPISNPVDLITTSKKTINDLGDGESFFTQPSDSDETISDVVVIK